VLTVLGVCRSRREENGKDETKESDSAGHYGSSPK
jgi:hypothetical protein